MPAIRTATVTAMQAALTPRVTMLALNGTNGKVVDVSKKDESAISYPSPSSIARATYVTDKGKRVTDHQWAVYDLVYTIPSGKVMTYKDVCISVGSGSPRSVGSALRNNPFAPYIPCHRVIASNCFVGGFCGEWGPDGKAGGKMYNKKLALLKDEGVEFDQRGMLRDRGQIWSGSD